MATRFSMTRDINGYNGFGLPPTDTAYSCTLTTSTDTSLTVPSTVGIGRQGPDQKSTWIAIFSYDPGTSVWVAKGVTATVPAGSSFSATASELNPSAWYVSGGDVLHFICAGTGVSVSVRLYSLD